MAFTFPSASDESDQKLLEMIETHGWGVIKVPEDDEGPNFAFTVGLWAHYHHPEIVMLGQRLELMHRVLNAIGAEVKTGSVRYEAGREYADLLEGYNCALVEVEEKYFEEYLGTAMWVNQYQPFRVLQCVWPDRSGLFPWQGEPNEDWLAVQPILGNFPVDP